MKTIVLKVDPVNPEPAKIQKAVAVLRAGGLVAFPTDTVYGIGADIFNEKAVQQIFSAKGRDRNKPLQVLVHSKKDLEQIVQSPPEILNRLVSRFWPGPLTLVMLARGDFPAWVRCGLDTVGVRMPANTVALKLIEAFGSPIAATSANISGTGDPVNADQVAEYLEDRVQIILDGGPTPGNVPSTVLDISVRPPVILRQGKLKTEELNRVIYREGISCNCLRRSDHEDGS